MLYTMSEEKPASGLKRTNIYLTWSQSERLGALSAKTGLSSAELIRRAIDEYLAKEAGQAKKVNK